MPVKLLLLLLLLPLQLQLQLLQRGEQVEVLVQVQVPAPLLQAALVQQLHRRRRRLTTIPCVVSCWTASTLSP